MTNTSRKVLDYIHFMVGVCRDDPRDDTQLLARFVESHDERAFTILLGRHGPLVWRTCTRVLGDGPEAEDAFQAAFLALARKASQLRGETLIGWLHQVARRAAVKADIGMRRQRSLEQRLRTVAQTATAEDADRAELYAALDEELEDLPERLRVPLVLRYLEGKTQDEVARILGCSRSVALRRLTRGETILRERLERRGLAVGVGSVAVLLGSTGHALALPARLIGSTVRAALRSLSFPESSTSAVLAEGMMKAMMGTKVKLVTVLLGLTLCLAGGGLLAYQALAGNAAEPPQPAGEPGGEIEASRQPAAASRVDCYGDPLPAHALARMGTTRLWRRERWDWDRGLHSIVFSPDGKTLATRINNGRTICLWDAATGKEIRRLTMKDVAALGFSPDGKTLVAWTGERAGPRGQTVVGQWDQWEMATGKFLRKQEYQRPKRGIEIQVRVAFLPGGKMLGVTDFMRSAEEGRERGTYVWDAATGKEICQLSEPRKKREDSWVSAFSPDGKLLATVMSRLGEKIIHLWDVTTGKEIRQLTTEDGRDGGVDAVAFSRDGKTLASGDFRKICVWEVASGKKIHLFPKAEEFPCNLLTYSPDGKTLLGGSERASHLLDVGTGKEIRSFNCDGAQVALFSPDGKVMAVGDNAGSIRLWEVASGKEIGPRKGYRRPICSIAYSPDSKTLASMSQDSKVTVRLWEVATGKEIRQLFKLDSWSTGSIAYSPDGKMLVSTGGDVIHLWDTATGKEIRHFKKRGGGTSGKAAATFSPDGKKLAAAWGSKVVSLVCVWEIATGEQICTLDTHQDDGVLAIAFSPDGRLLATPGKGNTVCLWEVATGELIHQLGRPTKQLPGTYAFFVFSLAFSPDGRMLATSSRNEDKVRLWEVASGKEIGRLGVLKPRFHEGCGELVFSPNSRILATTAVPYQNSNGQFDTVRLWDVASGKEIGQLTGHQGPVSTIAFSPDGKTMASGSRDLTCLVWDITSFTGQLKPVPARPLPAQTLSQERLEAAWADLAKDPAQAYAAIRALQAAPAQAIPLLRARVRPAAPPADLQQLRRWIADFDDNSFTVRDKARQEIEKLGEPAIPALRQALKDQPSLEVKRQLKDLLAGLEPPLVGGSPQRLRELRAVHVLESLGTVEARQVLQALAKGVAGARLTVEAEAALAHLSKRSAAKP